MDTILQPTLLMRGWRTLLLALWMLIVCAIPALFGMAAAWWLLLHT